MKLNKQQTMALLAMLTSINNPVFADDLNHLKEVVVSASRIEQDVNDVSTTVTILTDDDVEEQLPADAKDLMRFETGVSVRAQPNRASGVFRSTGRAGNEGINIRGLEGNQVLLQVDGVRLPSAYESGPFAAGRIDYIDLEAYKRIEILRGPSSTQFGSDGLSGAVSFITKDPQDLLTLGKPWQAAIKFGYSTVDNSWTTAPSFAIADDRFEAMVLGSFRQGHESDNKGTNGAGDITRTTPNPQDVNADYLLAKLVLKPNEYHRIKLTAEDLDRDVDTNVKTFFGDPFAAASLTGVALEEEITRQLFKVDYDYTNLNNQWLQRAKTSLYMQDAENRQYGLETRSTNPQIRTRDTNYKEETIGGGFQMESSFGSSINHHVVYGADASVTEVSSLREGFNSSGAAFVTSKSFPDTDYKLFGTFIQDEISIGQFSVVPGLRYDRFKLSPKTDALYLASTSVAPVTLKDDEVSPKLGVIWKLDPLANLYAQYAHGFRAPQPVQVNAGFSNIAFGYTTIGNPDLKPETSNSVEVGMRGRNNRLSYSASLFNGKYKDFIASNQLVGIVGGIQQFQSINLNDVEISGYELRGEFAFTNNWSASASYAHATGDTTNYGVKTPLNTIDPDKLVLGLRYDNEGQYGANLYATIVERKDRNPDASAFYTPEGYEVFDITAYYKFNEKLSINAGLFNLFDRKYFAWSDVRGLSPSYEQIDAYSQPGRNGVVSVKYQF
jgi:hemoglobin/transferrin/lactoferrin receptor protein